MHTQRPLQQRIATWLALLALSTLMVGPALASVNCGCLRSEGQAAGKGLAGFSDCGAGFSDCGGCETLQLSVSHRPAVPTCCAVDAYKQPGVTTGEPLQTAPDVDQYGHDDALSDGLGKRCQCDFCCGATESHPPISAALVPSDHPI